MEYGKWTKVAQCKCGFVTEAPFGSLFHIHFEVCPKCGSEKDGMKLRVARKGFGWFVKDKWIFKDE